MRSGLLLILASTAACTNQPLDPSTEPDAFASVRERFEQDTHLQLATGESSGAITAEKKTGAGWDIGTIPLPFANGELVLSSDAANALTIEDVQLVLAPIPLGDGLFNGRDAQLVDVRVDLEAPVRAAATWSSDNDVTLTAELPLVLHWAIDIEGSVSPLGTPRLPAVPVELHVTGDSTHVEASLSAHAPGELWTWAGVIKLSELELALSAALAPPL